MVVQLGAQVEAWATYPGGQSGNPVSARYRDRIPLWVNGELEPLRVPRSESELSGSRRTSALTLRPAH
jgi:acyl-homoserine lactone acylase PvdQ